MGAGRGDGLQFVDAMLFLNSVGFRRRCRFTEVSRHDDERWLAGRLILVAGLSSCLGACIDLSLVSLLVLEDNMCCFKAGSECCDL